MTRPKYIKIGNYWTIRPQAEPYHVTWQQMAVDAAKDAGEVILGVVVLLALMFGIPFLLWIGWAA